MSDRLDALDYYTLLGVDESASSDTIRAAFHTFALRYHPDRFAVASAEKRERAAQIYRRGAEAYRVLMETESRRRYDRGLARGRLRLEPEEERESRRITSNTRLSVSSPRARPFAVKALAAYKEGDYKTAKLNLTMALAHEPENPLLRARLEDVERKLGAC